MSPDLYESVTKLLQRDFKFSDKPSGQWIHKGLCPWCAEKKVFTHALAPWKVKCNRQDNCQYEAHIKDLYPDLFTDWSKRASLMEAAKPVEEQNPNAAADLYLKEGRGFDLNMLKGWYEQAAYVDPRTGEGSATVRFKFGNGHWERLIDRPERFGGQKARFSPGLTYGGHWWQPPTLTDELLNEVDELWIVEGIFDAIALLHNGKQAVSIMTCGNYPQHALRELAKIRGDKRGITLVWALDRGNAGERHLKEFYERATKEGWSCEAALPPERKKNQPDWNDLHLQGKLTNYFIGDYLHNGALLVAQNSTEKAYLIHKKTNRSMFSFSHAKQLYHFKLEHAKYDEARKKLLEEEAFESDKDLELKALRQSNSIHLSAPCNPTLLYFMRDEITDESWYYFRVERPNKGDVKGTFRSAELTTSGEFKKRLLHLVDGGLYMGDNTSLTIFLEQEFKELKRVETINFIGYAKEIKAYILGDVAIQNGKVIKINDEDYFELTDKVQVKSLSNSLSLQINTDEDEYSEAWLEWLWQAFGVKGYVALAYWFGSFFAEQIREAFKSYPFLEMVGDAGAGKTTLLEFLWKLTGRLEYEGFDPIKSSFAGRARTFEQVSNMPIALIEGDHGGSDKLPHARGFDFDETKPLYNGRPIRSIGRKTAGNDTYEPPFRASLVISQNNPVMASDATMQRICQLFFKLSDLTDASAIAAKQIESVPLEEVSYFTLKAIQSEKETLALLKDRVYEYDAELRSRENVNNRRIAYNHAQLMALCDALAKVVNISAERLGQMHNFLFDMAAERQQAINSDCQVVQEFWEAYEYINMPTGNFALNHSNNSDQIAINLNHFYTVARDRGQQVPDITQLRRAIKTSIRYKYLDYRNVASSTLDKSRVLRCYIFEAKRSAGED